MCPLLVILPNTTIKSRESFLLVLAHPVSPRERAVKQLWRWWWWVNLVGSSLTAEGAKILVQAFVNGRLDYCIGFLYTWVMG